MHSTSTTESRPRTASSSALSIAVAALLLTTSACVNDTTAPHSAEGVAMARVQQPSDTTGPRIAFNATIDNVVQIFTIDPGGAGLQRITKSRVSSTSPAWSPDRQRIAFVRHGRTWGSAIHTMDPRGRVVRRVTSDSLGFTYDPSWSPDGGTIVFAAMVPGSVRTELYTVLADGSTAPLRLTNDTLYDADPVFSPDGSKIAVTRYGGDTPSNIHIMDADGQNLHQFTFCAVGCKYASWSPDGGKLAFQEGDSLVVAALGFNPIAIAGGLTTFGHPRWSPDGSELVYVGSAGGSADLWAVQADGGPPRRITSSSTEERLPAWAE
jgi:TolB protein